jgi:hypothetical protein
MIEQQEPKLRTESNTEEDNSSEDTSDSSDIIIGDELTSGFRSNPIIVIRF